MRRDMRAILSELLQNIREWPERRDAEVRRTGHYVRHTEVGGILWDANVYVGMLRSAALEIEKLRDVDFPRDERYRFYRSIAGAYRAAGLDPAPAVEEWAKKQLWYRRERRGE